MKDQFSNHEKEALKNSVNVLNRVLDWGITGVGGLSGARELGDKYLNDSSYQSKREKIDALIIREELKNFTSGFMTSLGGFLTLPLAIPACLGANWVLQSRMVAAMAHIGGFDIHEPPVRMSIALSLLGKKAKVMLNSDLSKATEMVRDKKFSMIPNRTIMLVNQAIANRLMRTAASKGFSRLSKFIPLVGGVVGGALDYYSCRDTAEFARELFQLDRD